MFENKHEIMPRKAKELSLSPMVMRILEKDINKHQIELHYLIRMQIVYYSSKGEENRKISGLIGCHENTVAKWGKRWYSSQAVLDEFEKGYQGSVQEKDLRKKIKEILTDIPRPGAPPRLLETEMNRLTALACGSPEK